MNKDTNQAELDNVSSKLRPLESDGWRIEIAPEGDGRLGVSLQHELSSHAQFSLMYGGSAERIVTRILASHEVAVVRQAPKSMTHASLLGELRNSARAWDWPTNTLAQLAVALHQHGVLNQEEMEWLANAGAIQSL